MDQSSDQRPDILCHWIAGHTHSTLKYLNLEGFLEKSLKIKSALKSTGKSLKNLKSPCILLISVGLGTIDGYLNQYEIVVPLFGAAYAALHQI